MHRELSTDDVNVEGALFTTNKVGIVKSKFVIPPKMRMISPIPRRPSLIKPHDSDGNELDDSKYEIYKESDMNPLLQPCGGTKAGRVHFDAEAGSKTYVQWKTIHPDDLGNCTLKLA